MAGVRRANLAEKARRTAAVYELLLDGYTYEDLVAFITQTYKVGKRQAGYYVRWARERMEEELAKRRESALAEHIAARQRLRRKVTDDDRLVLQILKDEAELLGLYEQTVRLKGDKEEPVWLGDVRDLSDDELKQIAGGG